MSVVVLKNNNIEKMSKGLITSIVSQKQIPYIVPAVTGFITEWDTTASSELVTLPTVNAVGYNATIDWGDGSPETTITTWNVGNTHTYAVAGTYQIEIKGDLPYFRFQNAGDRLKIKKIINWGDADGFSGFLSLSNAFWGCANLNELPVDGSIQVSPIFSSISTMFKGCISLTSIPATIFNNITALVSTNMSIFEGCTSLSTVPSTLFNTITGGTNVYLDSIFFGCSSLSSVPEDLFKPFGTTLISGNQYFKNCSSLTSISVNIFKYNTNMTSMSYMFEACGITSIPVGIFSANTKVTSFSGTFKSCVGITTSIPSGLFANNNLVNSTGAYYLFQFCTNLSGAIPSGLFDTFTGITGGFYRTFQNCVNLTSIPVDLFRYNTLITGQYVFYETFDGCSQITSIPTDLFRYNTLVGLSDSNAQCFRSTFDSCGITTIPETLFSYNTEVVGFIQTFNSCPISAIPVGIFSANTKVTRFIGVFNGYNSTFTSIPTGLFANNNKVTQFASMFGGSDITSIPADIYSTFTGLTYVQGNWSQTTITGITAGIYDNCPLLATISGDFSSCQYLTEIPVDLFRYNTGVTNFSSVFSFTTSLTTVPTGVFKYNLLATDFSYTFNRCKILQLNPNIFDDDGTSGSTRFLNQSVNFRNCFDLNATFDLPYAGAQGTAPELWGYDFGTGTPTSTQTFLNRNTVDVLSNYADIPAGWY